MENRRKVLIIEDEMSLNNALRDKFTQKDFLVLQAQNGEEGLKIALDEHPDLILLDILMPKMDGITMLKQLRRDNWGKTIRVIILSNLAKNGKIDSDLLKEEVYEYVTKADCKIEDVVDMVCKRLGC